ncbi:MAG: asparaginase [Vicinamibacterales bacterium]
MTRLSRAATAGLIVAAAVAGLGARQAATPRVAVFTTGGTIASRPGQSMQDGASLIAAVPELARHAELAVREVTRVGSSQMTPALWLALASHIREALADPGLAGVVVTHGTDTLEDTAFFLDTVFAEERPIVLTGSMRSSTEISADGPANLLNAVRVATAPAARGMGVLVSLDEAIASARDVWKTENRRVGTFRSPELGFLGFVDPDGVVFYRRPVARGDAARRFDIADRQDLPAVPILTDYPGFDPGLMDGVLALEPGGVVVAAFAGGRMSAGAREAIARALAAGVPVVVSSHVPGGRIVGDPRGDLRAVLARDLPPNKARILLMLALTRTRDRDALQAIFDAR